MENPEFDRRLFSWVLWIFAGLVLLVLLTSCARNGSSQPVVDPAPAVQPSWTVTLTNQKQVHCDYIHTTDSELLCHNGLLLRWFDKFDIANIELVQ